MQLISPLFCETILSRFAGKDCWLTVIMEVFKRHVLMVLGTWFGGGGLGSAGSMAGLDDFKSFPTKAILLFYGSVIRHRARGNLFVQAKTQPFFD